MEGHATVWRRASSGRTCVNACGSCEAAPTESVRVSPMRCYRLGKPTPTPLRVAPSPALVAGGSGGGVGSMDSGVDAYHALRYLPQIIPCRQSGGRLLLWRLQLWAVELESSWALPS